MTDQAIEDTGGGDQEVIEVPVEDRARDMGWRPKEEFKGDESRWVDAETFVKRGEEILPILKANARKAEAEAAAVKAEMAELKASVAEFRKYHSQTEKRAYERAIRDLEERQAEAVEANDLKSVRAITKEIASLSKDVQTDDDGNPYKTPDHAKALNQWKGENPWFQSDRVMTAAADVIASELEQSGVKGAEQLAEVAKRIRAEFPHKFQNERRSAPAVVEGSTTPRKAGKSAADLPPEARAQMQKWVKQGLLTEKQFLKDYFL